ncbi:hypothetical protein PHMEG_00033793 [Phytophthora megakarya]|uniref:Reverse transcriptase n=1 Tax=Phytophthora megakarya TaxID=4795 RepID=A0A225USZ0_9STRA|nr:hypothetical protein PHMEG_00033793 [Phytophthora megakarya]
MVPTVMESRRGKPVWVRLTNVSDGTARCYKHSSVVLWIPKGELPREVGYVRLDSSKYNEWQVLAYAEGRDDTMLQKETELYECWLAEQPPAVERQEYTTPARILTRPTEDSVAPRKFVLGHPESDDRGDGVNSHHSVKMHDDSEASVAAGCEEEASEPDTQPTAFSDAGDDENDPAEDSVDLLELTYISVMQESEAEIAAGDKRTDVSFSVGLDRALVDGPNIMNKSMSEDEQRKLAEVLQRHEGIMIASGNALPPPAYGVVCDIDVQGHMPIKQRARRTSLRVLEQLYELLKGPLRAGLITFSDSPWASPIVIVLKKNGG